MIMPKFIFKTLSRKLETLIFSSKKCNINLYCLNYKIKILKTTINIKKDIYIGLTVWHSLSQV